MIEARRISARPEYVNPAISSGLARDIDLLLSDSPHFTIVGRISTVSPKGILNGADMRTDILITPNGQHATKQTQVLAIEGMFAEFSARALDERRRLLIPAHREPTMDRRYARSKFALLELDINGNNDLVYVHLFNGRTAKKVAEAALSTAEQLNGQGKLNRGSVASLY